MICSHCGTAIADKALVCFRCGAATAQPQTTVQTPKPSRSRRLVFLTAAVILLIVEYMFIQIQGYRVPSAVLVTILVLAGLFVGLAMRPRR
jgi:hypothetical protein